MTVQVQGDSQEAVAFGLMQCVLFAAGSRQPRSSVSGRQHLAAWPGGLQ